MNPVPRFATFANVFIPFALLLTGANVCAEAGVNPVPAALAGDPHLKGLLAGNPTFARVMYSIWITFLFATPAVGLFLLFDIRRAAPVVHRYWLLLWSFGFVAYAVHSYFATVVWFESDFAQIVERQSLPVVIVNYVLLAAWGIEVIASAAAGQGGGGVWLHRLQWFTHLLFLAAAIVAAVVFYHSGTTPKAGFSLLLGVALIAFAAFAIVGRLLFRSEPASGR